MIRYSLTCDARHGFEAWFRSADDCDRQIADGTLACPACGSSAIDRALMAPSISKSVRAPRTADPSAPPPEAPDQAQALMPHNPKLAQMAAALKELRERITANADDVGERFPEEARRIHYGESEARGIYGQASPEEAAALVEEGVEVMPLPMLPDDRN
ncbi:hypothetical protein AB7M35_003132 [Amorphus suaedae]